MLNLIGADWEPVWVDFFVKGEQRAPAYRTTVNEMGEVLVPGGRRLSQSGVNLTYLADIAAQHENIAAWLARIKALPGGGIPTT